MTKKMFAVLFAFLSDLCFLRRARSLVAARDRVSL